MGAGSVAERRPNLLLETGERSAVWEQSRLLVVLNYAALSFAVVMALWGTERIAWRLETLRAITSNVLDVNSSKQFREINSVSAPLIASAAAAIAFALSALIADG